MHTFKIIAVGLLLLAACLLIGRWTGAAPSAGMALGVKVFIALWLIGAGINMWVGVSKAGYSIADEAPIFGVVFAIPAGVALLVWWLVSRTP